MAERFEETKTNGEIVKDQHSNGLVAPVNSHEMMLFQEAFTRINTLEKGQAETNGYLKALVETGNKQLEQNEKYLKLVWRVIIILGALLFISVLTIIYGAIGEKGLKSVRDSVPAMPKMPQNVGIPWNGGGLEKWINGSTKPKGIV